MVLDPIPQPLPVRFFGSRPQPPTSRSEGVHQKGPTSGKISGLQTNLNQNPDDHKAKTKNSTAPRKGLILDTVSRLHKSGDTSLSLPTKPLNYTVAPDVAPAPAYYSIVAPIQYTKKARGGETAGGAQKEKLGAKSARRERSPLRTPVTLINESLSDEAYHAYINTAQERIHKCRFSPIQ